MRGFVCARLRPTKIGENKQGFFSEPILDLVESPASYSPNFTIAGVINPESLKMLILCIIRQY